MNIAQDGAKVVQVLGITSVIEAEQIIAEGFPFDISRRPSKDDNIGASRGIAGIKERSMRLGGKISTDAVEPLERSSGGSRNIFAKTAHSEDEVNPSDVAKVEEAAVSRSVGAAIFCF